MTRFQFDQRSPIERMHDQAFGLAVLARFVSTFFASAVAYEFWDAGLSTRGIFRHVEIAGILAFLLATIEFFLFWTGLYDNFRKERKLVGLHETVGGFIFGYITRFGTIYSASMWLLFLAVFLKNNHLFLGMLCAWLVSSAVGVLWSIPTLRAALSGGGAGLSEEDMEHTE